MGALSNASSLGELISALYSYALSVVGLCVFVMFLYAGLCYIVSNGKTYSGKPASDIFKDAVIGTVLLYSAYIILNSINHDLVNQGVGMARTIFWRV